MIEMNAQDKPIIKLTLVGDAIGKSFILNAFVYDKLPDYSFSLFEHHKKTIKVDNQVYQLELHDTPGQSDYEKLRPLSYPNTNCFIMCFSISQQSSYANIIPVWLNEIRHHMPDTPIILVGTQLDLREDSKMEIISYSEGKKLQRQIKAKSYIECSATKRINLDKVFEEAVRCSIGKKTLNNSKKECILL